MTTRLLRFLLLGYAATATARVAHAQDLQLHYDWRHTVDPRNNARDFPALTFKTFKALEFGSFLLKLEANLDGAQHNVSKGYLEVSQTLRFWKAPVYALGEYTGGLGLFDGASGGFYIANAYLVGVAYPFKLNGSWASASTRVQAHELFASRATTRKRRSTGDDRWASAGRSRRRACSGPRIGIVATSFTTSLTGKEGAFLSRTRSGGRRSDWCRSAPRSGCLATCTQPTGDCSSIPRWGSGTCSDVCRSRRHSGDRKRAIEGNGAADAGQDRTSADTIAASVAGRFAERRERGEWWRQDSRRAPRDAPRAPRTRAPRTATHLRTRRRSCRRAARG